MKTKSLLLVLPLVLYGAGCATLVSGSNQDLQVNSNPSGAKIFIDDEPVGQTPISISVKRKKEHQLRLELPGYQPYLVKLEHNVNLWTVGNIFNLTGFVGVAIDYVNGALFWLDPSQVNKQLEASGAKRTGSTAGASDGTFHIFMVMQPDTSWHRAVQLTK